MTEELKEQIHERIYNLKVPTLGFSRQDLFDVAMEYVEPREKLIEELEYQLTHRNCLDCSNHSSKLRMRNLDLEKENAELKKKYAKECEDVSYAVTNYSKQLTKARKLLKTLIEDYISEPEVLPDGSCEDNELRNLIKEVEQFLKENKE